MNNKEKEVVTHMKKGDKAAFEKLYQTYADKVMGYITRSIGQKDRAEELMQEVFLKIWEKRNLIDADKSFGAYIFQIARNLLRDFYRKVMRSREVQIAEVVTSLNYKLYSGIEDTIDKKQKIYFLHQSIAKLPPRRKLIYELVKLEERSYEEVSQQLKVSKATINDHIVKATKFLREDLKFLQPGLLFRVN